jgi:hypothetical protein
LMTRKSKLHFSQKLSKVIPNSNKIQSLKIFSLPRI